MNFLSRSELLIKMWTQRRSLPHVPVPRNSTSSEHHLSPRRPAVRRASSRASIRSDLSDFGSSCSTPESLEVEESELGRSRRMSERSRGRSFVPQGRNVY